ncbi:hypothetical protein THIOM_002535 [Candidatus Thiomargarita nelsonii]|uniref:Uncharacterized protein n=1 Tax=Candidatus Thiomargarita nelsonii TaxID=1003181 RepID=A0A176S0U8_9GAMM|nr:hypothetical protein THIOM_002535 [Candidatus Thiomargarita nelsonii]
MITQTSVNRLASLKLRLIPISGGDSVTNNLELRTVEFFDQNATFFAAPRTRI